MAGITSLNDIYKKNGKEYVQDLFTKNIVVTERFDANTFSFEKKSDGELSFYKRNTDIPISLIDRTLMRMYEGPIQHFTSMDPNVLKTLPVGWRFGFDYFTDKRNDLISYDGHPKNDLVLTNIQVKNNAGKTVRTIQDISELKRWADALNVEGPPIIFNGKLNNDQVIQIMDFLDVPYEELSKKFKTTSFVRYLVSIMNPSLKKVMKNDGASIEGLVFRFNDDQVLAKVMDPIFELMSREKEVKKEDTTPNDIYQLTIMDFTNYLESKNFNRYKLKGKTLDERYMNFICQAFNDFIEDHGERYLDLSFNEPAFMKKSEFDINKDFIKDPKTLNLLDENKSYVSLFKIVLASFRKRKNRAVGMMTSDVIRQFNMTVNKINTYLSRNLNENEMPTFGDFIYSRSDDEHDISNDAQAFAEFRNRILQSERDPEDEIINKKKNKRKKVNILVGKFQPFHNGHLSVLKDLYDVNGHPCLIVIVRPKGQTESCPFIDSTVDSIMNNIKVDGGDFIEGYCTVSNSFIHTIVSKVRDMGLEPVLWGCGKDRINDYRKQIEHNFKQGNKLGFVDGFNMMETELYGQGKEARSAIEQQSFSKFKELVPKSVQSCYQLMLSDIETLKRSV